MFGGASDYLTSMGSALLRTIESLTNAGEADSCTLHALAGMTGLSTRKARESLAGLVKSGKISTYYNGVSGRLYRAN